MMSKPIHSSDRNFFAADLSHLLVVIPGFSNAQGKAGTRATARRTGTRDEGREGCAMNHWEIVVQ